MEHLCRCLVPKLAKNYDESNDPQEFKIRNNNLNDNINVLLRGLDEYGKADFQKSSAIVANIIILEKELASEGPWNNTKAKDNANKINNFFESKTKTSIKTVLGKSKVFKSQEIFEICIKDLHSKLTYEDFKKYPAQIEVYCSFMLDLKEYNFSLIPSKIFPACLLLVEDYIISNKLKGLRCCSNILKLLKTKDFDDGNYYDVIYRSLKKNLIEQDIDVTKQTHACILALLKILPIIVKREKLDDMYSAILDQLSTEGNLYKKAACFNFTINLIQWNKENCCNRKTLYIFVICCSLNICTNEAVSNILLNPILKSMEKWIVYCWPVWHFYTDYRLLSQLFKVYYICKDDSCNKLLHKLIVTLISLSTVEERRQIISRLGQIDNIKCETFKKKLGYIRAELNK